MDKRLDIEVAPDLLNEQDAGALHNDHGGDFVTLNEQRDLVRGLHQRHISLIALAGAIVRYSSPS